MPRVLQQLARGLRRGASRAPPGADRGARWGGRSVALAMTLASLFDAALAAASNDAAPGQSAAPEPVYDVAAGCPARSVWLERVLARLPDVPAAPAALERLPVHIHSSTAAGYRGWVGAQGDAIGATERGVRGRACGEVFDALVLIAALSLEQSAEASVPSAAPAAGESLAAIVLPDEPVEPASAAPPADLGTDGTAAPGAELPSLGALGFAQAQTGVAPAAALDVGAALIVSWHARHFDPWLLVGAYMGAAPQVTRVERATARFEHWSARALGCPWRFPRDGWAALRPCAGLDVGRSRGEGAGVAGAVARSAPWVAGLAELRLDIALPAGVSLGASGGAVVPFVRPRFYFEPGVVAYQPALVGFAASSFVALSF